MQKLNKQKGNTQTGFTLIELVVVIVILGILAVTAAPKFIDIQDDAHTATLQAVKASMQTVSTLVHSKSLIKGNETAAPATAVFVTVNGDPVKISYGYPRSDSKGAATSWGELLDVSDFTIAFATASKSVKLTIVYPTTGNKPTITAWEIGGDATADANCFTYYSEVTTSGDAPVVGTVNCL